MTILDQLDLSLSGCIIGLYSQHCLVTYCDYPRSLLYIRLGGHGDVFPGSLTVLLVFGLWHYPG